ncbi:MAG: DUF47 family protein [Methanomicrobiales archaeon]|nr:DUF47 family protein [Methanomicrobiales archaeon]
MHIPGNLRDIILPEEKVFFSLFEEMATTIVEAADILVALTTDLAPDQTSCRRLRVLEHNGDGITRQIFESLNRSLITPLEPEEIARLASALDDVLDRIDWVGHQICNYDIDEPNAPLKEFSLLIASSAREIQNGIQVLRIVRRPAELQTRSVEINRLWNQGSDLLSRATPELFKTRDPVRIIKLKDIYESMASVLEKCNDLGHVLFEISRSCA